MQAINKDKRYTYADYAAWDDDSRYEIIDGVAYMMAPAPSIEHQRVSRELSYQITDFLKGKPCEVFTAPIDVRLNAEQGDDTVVQPDLIVVCDKSKLDGKRCNGAPDMVIEISSPSTSRNDKVLKLNKYRQAGVREYWIVDPDDKIVLVYILKNGEYVTKGYVEEDTISVHVLEGCTINLKTVFPE